MTDDDRGPLADRLDHLFRTVLSPAGKPYSLREIAARCRAAGTDISHNYIALLRSGERSNPTIQHVQALADAFGVPPAYFFDDVAYQRTIQRLAERRAADDLDALANDPDAVQFAVMARGLGAGDLQNVMALVKSLLERDRPASGHRNSDDQDEST